MNFQSSQLKNLTEDNMKWSKCLILFQIIYFLQASQISLIYGLKRKNLQKMLIALYCYLI